MKTIIFCNARDESTIHEWVAHHLLLGFDLIYLFDHKSIIPIQHSVSMFKKGVIVERCDINGSIKLPLMMKAAKIAQSAGADWLMYLDADEYLVLPLCSTVKEFLTRFQGSIDQICIPWLLFGTNQHVHTPKEGLLIDQYTASEETLDQHVKSFVRPGEVVRALTPHSYIIRNMSRTFSLPRKGAPFSTSAAFVAHYVFQSEERYIQRKLQLPRDDNYQFRGAEPNLHEKHNNVLNTFVKDKYAQRIQVLLDKLR